MRFLLHIFAAACVFGQSQTLIRMMPKSDNSATGPIQFFGLYGPGQNYVGLAGPDSISSPFTLKLPPALPAADGQCLTGLTSGQLAFSTSTCAEKLVADYDWSKNLGALAAGPSTLTITFGNNDCPAYGSEAQYVIRVHEALVPTTDEIIISTGYAGVDSCVPGGNGVIKFSHGSIAFTTAIARSATSGWQESIFRVPDGYSVYVRAGVGGYDIHSDILTGTRNLHVKCDSEWALLQPKEDNLHVFNVQGPRAGVIDGCQVYNGSFLHAGVTAVYFYNPSGNSYGGKVKNMTISEVENGIRLRTGYNSEVQGNKIINATHAAIWQANAATPDGGSGSFTENKLSCSTTCDYGLFWEGPGALRYSHNTQNGYTEQVHLEPVGGTSQISVNDNDFDGGVNTTHGIRWVGAGVIYSVQMIANIVHSYVTSPAAASGIVIEGGGAAIVQIADNDLASPPGFGTGKGIDLQASTGYKLSSNIVWGWDTGINIGAGATDIEEEGTRCKGNATACITNASTTAILGPKTPIAFAALPSIAANGSKVFCSDCDATAGTAACAASGTGANATRINGAWKCERGSTDTWTVSGSDVYRPTGTVAIGTTPSSAQLRIAGPAGGGGSAAVYEQQHGSGTGHFQLTTESTYTLLNNVTNTQMIFGTDNTARWLISAAGIFAPNLDNTYDAGTDPLRIRALYGYYFDGAPSGTTGNYVSTRSLKLADLGGGTATWQFESVASSTAGNLNLKDQAGDSVIKFHRKIASSPVDYADVYVDLYSDIHNGQKLGKSGQHWSEAWITDIHTSGGHFHGHIDPPTTNLYRIGGSSSRYAEAWSVLGNFSGLLTTVGLTINTASPAVVGECWLATSTGGAGDWDTCTGASQWTTSGSDIYYTTGQVRIGDSASHIGSKVEVTNSASVNLIQAKYTGATATNSGGGISAHQGSAPTAADHRLGFMVFGAEISGTQYNRAAISAYSSQAWTLASAEGAYLSFATTATGSTTRTDRWHVEHDGNFAPASANSYTVGTASLPALANYSQADSAEQQRIANPGSSHATYWDWRLQSASELRLYGGSGSQFYAAFSTTGTNANVIGLRGSLYPMNTAGSDGDLGYSGTPFRALFLSGTATMTGLTINTASPAVVGECWLATSTGGAGDWNTCPGGLPATDTTGIAKGSSDPTKIVRFEVDGFTSGVTRVLTPPNADTTIAGISIAQTFSNTQEFAGTLYVSGNFQLPTGTASLIGDIIPATTNVSFVGDSTHKIAAGWFTQINTVNAAFTGTVNWPSGSNGVSTTISCPATQALKSITISGGGITSISCGVP